MGAEIRSFMISLLVFSGVIVGMSFFYVDLTSPTNLAAYGYTPAQIANISPEDLSSRDVANDIIEQTKAIEETLKQQPTGITAVDVAWGYINAGLSALLLPLNSVSLFTNMIDDVSSFIGLPTWVSVTVIGIISLIILMEIMSAYLKWRI